MDFSMISHKRNSFGIDKMPTLPKTSQRSKDMYVPSMSIFPLKSKIGLRNSNEAFKSIQLVL